MTSQADITRKIRVFMILRGHPHPGQRYHHGWVPVDAGTLTAMASAPESIRDLHVEEHDPDHLQQLHDITSEEKFDSLVEDMSAHGWKGAPVVVIPGADYGFGEGDPVAVTGSHRVAAARDAGINVPTVDLNDVLARFGHTLDELDERYGTLPDDERHYEAVAHLDEVLPADVVAYLGFDLH